MGMPLSFLIYVLVDEIKSSVFRDSLETVLIVALTLSHELGNK